MQDQSTVAPQPYVIISGKWGDTTRGTPGGVVTWSIAGAGHRNETGFDDFYYGNSVSLSSFLRYDYTAVLRQAFAAWSAVANIEFVQVEDGGGSAGFGRHADIRIFAGSIDGDYNVLGQAYYPGYSWPQAGDVVFDSDDAEVFSNPANLLGVAMHEIGHTLGLDHSTEPGIMGPGGADNTLEADDIAGARAIYGNQDGAIPVYVMPDSLLNLTVHDNPSAAILVGNALGNSITGSARGERLEGRGGHDRLDGRGGADRLEGGAGNDSYFVDALDVIVETAGNGIDRVYASASFTLGAGQEIETFTTNNNAGTAAINLTGNAFAQAINGNAGANTLRGGGGRDTLGGLAGNDLYVVDSADDLVIETVGNGTADRIMTTVSLALTSRQEIELLTTANAAGSTALNLTGNSFAQDIQGNGGANILRGGGGRDTMQGLAGNDLYFVDSVDDVVLEVVGNGTADRIISSVSYALAAGSQVDNLTTADALGTLSINLIGNELAQSIGGNAGANIINGRGGIDTLNGLGGTDTFVFDTALGSGNIDTIGDFNVTQDTIRLENAVFTGLAVGTLAAGALAIGTAATQADDRIIYNATSGALFFDRDGAGGVAQVQFARLSAGLALTSADFVVI